jgi:hypothetical protein
MNKNCSGEARGVDLAKILNHSGIVGDSNVWDNGVMKTQKKYSPEVRERTVRLVNEHQKDYPSHWSAICCIARKSWPGKFEQATKWKICYEWKPSQGLTRNRSWQCETEPFSELQGKGGPCSIGRRKDVVRKRKGDCLILLMIPKHVKNFYKSWTNILWSDGWPQHPKNTVKRICENFKILLCNYRAFRRGSVGCQLRFCHRRPFDPDYRHWLKLPLSANHFWLFNRCEIRKW